jgi:hypothetical protein
MNTPVTILGLIQNPELLSKRLAEWNLFLAVCPDTLQLKIEEYKITALSVCSITNIDVFWFSISSEQQPILLFKEGSYKTGLVIVDDISTISLKEFCDFENFYNKNLAINWTAIGIPPHFIGVTAPKIELKWEAP